MLTSTYYHKLLSIFINLSNLLIQIFTVLILNHEDANSSDPNRALANILIKNAHKTSNLKIYPSNQNTIYIPGSTNIKRLIDISKLDFALIIDILLNIPKFTNEKINPTLKKVIIICRKLRNLFSHLTLQTLSDLLDGTANLRDFPQVKCWNDLCQVFEYVVDEICDYLMDRRNFNSPSVEIFDAKKKNTTLNYFKFLFNEHNSHELEEETLAAFIQVNETFRDEIKAHSDDKTNELLQKLDDTNKEIRTQGEVIREQLGRMEQRLSVMTSDKDDEEDKVPEEFSVIAHFNEGCTFKVSKNVGEIKEVHYNNLSTATETYTAVREEKCRMREVCYNLRDVDEDNMILELKNLERFNKYQVTLVTSTQYISLIFTSYGDADLPHIGEDSEEQLLLCILHPSHPHPNDLPDIDKFRELVKTLPKKTIKLDGAAGHSKKRSLVKLEGYREKYFKDERTIMFPRLHESDDEMLRLITSLFEQAAIKEQKSLYVIFTCYEFQKLLNIMNINLADFKLSKQMPPCDIIILDENSVQCVQLCRTGTFDEFIKCNKSLEQIVKRILLICSDLIIKCKILISATIAFPTLSKNKVSQLQYCDNCSTYMRYLTKDDLSEEHFSNWWTKYNENLTSNLGFVTSLHQKVFKDVIDRMMVFKAIGNSCLPKPSENEHQSIQSIQILYPKQLQVLEDKSLKKIITGNYGSGKSIITRQILKTLCWKSEPDTSVIYYISFDHSSLFRFDMDYFRAKVKTEVPIFCYDLYELSMESEKDDLLSISETLQYIAEKHRNTNIHAVMEEIDGEQINEEEAARIKELLTHSSYINSTTIFVPQSVTKERRSQTRSGTRIHKSHCYAQTGMNVFELSEAIRSSGSIFKVTKVMEKMFEEVDSVAAIRTAYLNKTTKQNDNSNHPSCKRDSQLKQSIDQNKRTISIDPQSIGIIIDPNTDQLLKGIPKVQNIEGHKQTLFTSLRYYKTVCKHGIEGGKPQVLEIKLEDKNSYLPLCFFVQNNLKNKQNLIQESLIICNYTHYRNSMKLALERTSIPYESYFNEISSPTPTEEKRQIYRRWKDEKCVLLTDSKGCRGIESANVILVIDEDEHFERHLLIESLCRSTSKLAIASFGSSGLRTNVKNFIRKIIDEGLAEDVTHHCNQEYKLDPVYQNIDEFALREKTNEYGEYDRSKLAKFFGSMRTKEGLTQEELTHNWTFQELYNLILEKKFDKLNAILLSLRILFLEQYIGEYNNTLLHHASNHHAPIATLQLLIKKGCCLRMRNNINTLPIHVAARTNNIEAVKLMLHEDNTLLNDKGEYDRTPLHCAAMLNNVDTVEFLLLNGADTNTEDWSGRKADELSFNNEIKTMINEFRR